MNNDLYNTINKNKDEEEYNNLLDMMKMSNKINDLINLRNEIHKIIALEYNKIDKFKNLIIKVEEKIKINCEHEWIRDYTYYGEHSEYKCNYCGLNK